MEKLLSQADNTVSGMTPKENFPDPADRATLEADRNFMLRIRDRENKLIKKIKKALNALTTARSESVKNAVKIFPSIGSRPDRLRHNVLIVKPKKKL